MSVITITAADVNKLRTQTGAGMMDCKKALMEAEGDFEKAVDYLRKKGQKVAANRGDRDAKEGCVLAKVTPDAKRGVVVTLSCETDFVAINEDFVGFTTSLLNLAIDKNPATSEAFLALPYENLTVAEKITEYVGKIGEKIELSRYEVVSAEKVVAYIHPGNKLATLVGFNKSIADEQVGKDVAMQIAAMSPVAVDKGDVDPSMLEREVEIAKEQLRNEGKPEDKIEMIAKGKIEKFYKESTLLNQEFIKDGKKTVSQYLNDAEKGLTVTAFKRVALS
ncbi:MAG: elongation factor Ts [Bacteroidetes bacterium]|nr:elongation factor Ts [Bacteroidota bacterium]MBK9671729.1 elongation factor Ts [Bacteroidota bacterium]